MQQPQTRFHGEVKVQRNGTEIRVNIFENDRETLYFEIAQAIAQFSGDIKPQPRPVETSGKPSKPEQQNSLHRQSSRRMATAAEHPFARNAVQSKQSS